MIHRRSTLILILTITLFGAPSPLSAAASNGRIAVWDTGSALSASLAQNALADTSSWTQIARGEEVKSFRGDAVLTGGPTVVVIRGRTARIELYAVRDGNAILRSQLQLLTPSGGPVARLENVRLLENSRSAAAVDVAYRSKEDARVTVQVRVKRADVAVELRPGPDAAKLRVDSAGRFAILPDFFADDIVLDATSIAAQAVDIPSENFLLLPTGHEDCIVMCTFENREQDVRISLAGSGANRTIASSEIGFGGSRRIWVALLDAPRIWNMVDVDAEKTQEPTRLRWTAPFAAQWRADFSRKNHLSDSWEMLLPDPRGDGYLKPTWLGQGASRITADRKRWTTVLGWFEYPCWIDHDGQAYIQPMKHRVMTFKGPAIVYPINRLAQTPSDRFTVVDVVRNTLGVGPCEYILNVEGQKQEYKGRATCACRDGLTAIYAKNAQQAEQQEIEQILRDGVTFVTHIRGRITEYLAFARALRTYLADQKRLHPELATFLDDMDQITSQIETRYKEKLDMIKTPAHVAAMNDEFRKTLLHADGPDTMARLKAYTDALTRIGGNQDELVGQCRWTAKTLRQRAGIAMAEDPRCAAIAEQIRAKCQKAMLKPASYEAARH